MKTTRWSKHVRVIAKFIPNDEEQVVQVAAIRNKRNDAIYSRTPRCRAQILQRDVYGEQPLKGRPKEGKTEFEAEAKGESGQSENRRKTKTNRRQKPKRRLKQKIKTEVKSKRRTQKRIAGAIARG